MTETLCRICDGYKALPSKRTDIWCPSCNLEMYLVDAGLIQEAKYEKAQAIPHSIRTLQEELNHFWICRRMTREESEQLIQQARELYERIKANPELGDELAKKHEAYLRAFKAEGHYHGLTERKSRVS